MHPFRDIHNGASVISGSPFPLTLEPGQRETFFFSFFPPFPLLTEHKQHIRLSQWPDQLCMWARRAFLPRVNESIAADGERRRCVLRRCDPSTLWGKFDQQVFPEGASLDRQPIQEVHATYTSWRNINTEPKLLFHTKIKQICRPHVGMWKGRLALEQFQWQNWQNNGQIYNFPLIWSDTGLQSHSIQLSLLSWRMKRWEPEELEQTRTSCGAPISRPARFRVTDL